MTTIADKLRLINGRLHVLGADGEDCQRWDGVRDDEHGNQLLDAMGGCVEALRDLVPAMQAHSTQKSLSREPGWEPPNLTRKLNTQYIPAAWAALAKLEEKP